MTATTTATACAKQPCHRRATRRGMCHAHYEQHRSRQQAYGRWESVYVDAEPVRLHIKSLQAAGLGLRRIAALAQVNRKTLQWVTTGRSERQTGPAQKITKGNAELILAVPLPEVAHELASDHQLVDATGTRRRLQALMADGHPRAHLARHLNILPSNATRLFDPATATVLAATARRVADLFARLQMTPGPSSRARNEGARRGWPKPLAWDEDTIDDPAAKLITVREERVGFVERYLELRELGYGNEDIARRVGITPESLERQLYRHRMKVA